MNSNNDNRANSGIPKENASKPMDSKKDVEQSPDEKTDQDFPGYPHYPAKEDVMHKDSGMHRVDEDVENRSAGSNASGVSQRYASADDNSGNAQNAEIGVPQNVSNDDLQTGDRQAGTDLDEAEREGA